jgi:hypothetical protein
MNLTEAVNAKNSHQRFNLPSHRSGDMESLNSHASHGYVGRIITLFRSGDESQTAIVFHPEPQEYTDDVIATLQCVCGVAYYRTLIDQLDDPSSMQKVDYFNL